MVNPGSSLGGARPKNVVEDDEGLWVAKFPARNDRWNNAAVEGGNLRHRMVSALTVLRADENPLERSKWSYVRLADELKRWVGNPDQDLRELFSRMVFNALISNVDDHPRNHALIAAGQDWTLSPACDLTPMPQASTERDLAMEVGSAKNRRANRNNLLSECGRFRMSREDASHLIDTMKATVSARWRVVVRECGGTDADLKAIERAFDYEGFEYD